MADDPLVNAIPTNEPGPGPGRDPVSARMIWLLAFYLVVLTGLLLLGIYWKWPSCGVACANQIASSGSPAPTPAATPAATTPSTTTAGAGTTGAGAAGAGAAGAGAAGAGAAGAGVAGAGAAGAAPPIATISIDSVSPKAGQINCNTQVTIKGKGFKPGASVIFGGVPANAATVDPGGQYINVQSPAHAEGDVDLVVKNPDGTSSDIAKAAYSYSCPPASDSDLFLLVVFAGALGGVLHGLRSFAWYVGLRSLVQSWTLMYILLPFTGATIAVIFYAVIRAGLLPVQANKNTSVALIAIAVLVGLFSQQAAVKLKDIADAFLAKPASGPPSETKPQGSLPPGGAPVVKPGATAPVPAINPATGPAGTPVTITGTGMKTVKSVTFGGVPGTAITIAADGTITVTPPTPAAGQVDPVEVVVTGDKDPVKLSFTYKP
jgi:hypothetical protein